MIIIGEPKLTKRNKKARLTAEVSVNNEVKELWIEFDEKYSKYIVKDRADAFVVALLPYAFRNKKDIICNSTVSEELLHNLRNQLIPAISKGSSKFYKTRVSADINKKVITNTEAVGATLTLDADGLHILSRYLEPEYPNMKITHLCVNEFDINDIEDVEKNGFNSSNNPQILKALELANELDLSCIHVKSNLLTEFDINYKLDHLYCELFPVFALQRLFKIYFCGSGGWDYHSFSLLNSYKRDAASYGLLLESAFSRSNFRLYLDGGDKDNLEKFEDVMHFAQSHRYLHSCDKNEGKNCGICNKCVRTLLTLDAMERVDYFSQVYDADYYKKNRQAYISYLEKAHENKDPLLEPVYKIFERKKQLTCSAPKLHVKGIVAPENIHTAAIILKDLTSNAVILSKQTREYMPAVCVGKIITTLVALESEKSQLVVDFEEGVIKGVSKASIYDLIHVMLNTQNNLVSNIIAQEVAGSVPDFMELVKDKLSEIKVKNTNLTNPCGIGANNYTTAEDVLKIMEYALKNLYFNKMFRTTSYSFYACDDEIKVTAFNPVLKSKQAFYVPECVGARYAVQGSTANHIAIFNKYDKTFVLILLGIKDPKNELLRFSEVKNIMGCIF